MGKKVNIDRIVVRGFGTYVKEYIFDVDRGGVNIIRGQNGAGKTTLFSALVWCLYQVNLKGTLSDAVATWKEVRPKDWNGTRVVVYLRVDGVKYAIARHIKFKGNTYGVPGESDLLIFKENEEGELTKGCLVSSVRGKADTQAVVDKLLGVDARTFTNSVMFVQRSRRFIEADNAEKRKLLEELFDLGFVDRMKEVADEKVKKFQQELDENTNERGRLEVKREGIDDRLEDARTAVEKWEQRRDIEVQELKEEADEVSNEHDNKEKEILACDKVISAMGPKVGDTQKVKQVTQAIDQAYRKALDEHSAGKVHLGDVEREINRLKEQIKDKKREIDTVKTTCPTCGSALKAEKIKEVKDAKGKELKGLEKALGFQEEAAVAGKNRLKELSEAYDAAAEKKEKDGDALAAMLRKYTQAVDQKKIYEGQLPGLRTRHDAIKEKIKKLNAGDGKPEVDVPGLEKEALKVRESIVELSGTITKLEKRISRYNWWRSTGLGVKGLKAYVFSAMLEQLNRHMEKYAERMGLGVRFSVDLTKPSMPFVTECFKDGILVDYRDLSGGEKQRIDIAMLFAMHDLVTTIVKFNVLVMDEVFEGLDQEGMEQVFDLIRTKAGSGTTVYVITHSTRVDTLQCRKLEVVKKDGQSELQKAA